MNTTTTHTPEAVANIVRRLMNGEALPAPETDEFAQFERIVAQILRAPGSDREHFGVLVLGHLIAAAQSHIKAAQVLRNFGSGAFE